MKAEIHFFHSGNGDTILIRGGEEWGLVDANFVKALKVRQRVESVLKGVKKLRFVCITHFDCDHIRGLGKFLKERFSEINGDGRRIWHIEQIILPIFPTSFEILASLKKLFEKGNPGNPQSQPALQGNLTAHASTLLDILCEMYDQGSPEFLYMPPGKDLFGPQGKPDVFGIGPWRCVCLGPRLATSDKFTRQLEACFINGSPASSVFRKVRSNEVSRVFALQHDSTGSAVLLTGDSTTAELESALVEWRQVNTAARRAAPAFQTVKVSHHGAATCHVLNLYENHCDQFGACAVICARDDGKHPHQTVIDDLKRLKIDCRVTGPPASPRHFPRKTGVAQGAQRLSRHSDDIALKRGMKSWEFEGGRLSQLHGSSLPYQPHR